MGGACFDPKSLSRSSADEDFTALCGDFEVLLSIV